MLLNSVTSENKLEKGRERGFLEFFSLSGLRIFEPEIILPFEEGNSNLQVLNIDQRKDLKNTFRKIYKLEAPKMIVVPRNINQTALLSSNYVKKPRTQIYIHQNIGTRVHLSKDKDVST